MNKNKKYEICGIDDDWATFEGNIIKHAVEYVKDSGVRSLVVGLSGGVDSTLTCALARKVCDQLGTKLIGVSLPTAFNKTEEVNNGDLTGEAFCDEFYKYNINSPAVRLTEQLTREKYTGVKDGEIDPVVYEKLKVRRGNIAARVRMISLYHIAHENDGLVLSTDNFTELLLGFWTLHGDVGDFGMLQNLWKTEVYSLASHMFVEESAKDNKLRAEALFVASRAKPTDGLGVTETDLDQIGAESYSETDKILVSYLNGDAVKLSHPVIQRHLRSHFKRNNPYNLRREDIIT